MTTLADINKTLTKQFELMVQQGQSIEDTSKGMQSLKDKIAEVITDRSRDKLKDEETRREQSKKTKIERSTPTTFLGGLSQGSGVSWLNSLLTGAIGGLFGAGGGLIGALTGALGLAAGKLIKWGVIGSIIASYFSDELRVFSEKIEEWTGIDLAKIISEHPGLSEALTLAGGFLALSLANALRGWVVRGAGAAVAAIASGMFGKGMVKPATAPKPAPATAPKPAPATAPKPAPATAPRGGPPTAPTVSPPSAPKTSAPAPTTIVPPSTSSTPAPSARSGPVTSGQTFLDKNGKPLKGAALKSAREKAAKTVAQQRGLTIKSPAAAAGNFLLGRALPAYLAVESIRSLDASMQQRIEQLQAERGLTFEEAFNLARKENSAAMEETILNIPILGSVAKWQEQLGKDIRSWWSGEGTRSTGNVSNLTMPADDFTNFEPFAIPSVASPSPIIPSPSRTGTTLTTTGGAYRGSPIIINNNTVDASTRGGPTTNVNGAGSKSASKAPPQTRGQDFGWYGSAVR